MMPQKQVIAKSVELNSHVERLKEVVSKAVEEHRPLHEVEEQTLRILLQLGRATLQLLFDTLGLGDVGETYALPDGRLLNRLEQHERPYLSIFGEFQLSRYVYGERSGRKQELVPLDSRLALPESKFSYLLQDWDQSLVMDQPFADVSETIQKILGFRQHVDSLETMNRQMAEAVDSFRLQVKAPPAEEEGEILVETGDGKGVPIRRPADYPAIENHRSQPGPKPDRKKMAIVGSVYSVDRFHRTPEEVVEALFRDPDQPRPDTRRPRPRHKRAHALLNYQDDHNGDSILAASAVFGWIADEIASRNASGTKEVVCIMDGQESLWEALDAQQHATTYTVDVLDLLHVTPRLWKAAHLFCKVDSPEATEFVYERVLKILHGEVRSVVRGLRRMASLRELSTPHCKTLETICNYFLKNQDKMRYHEYLQRGYPIASGVIEGACRYIVKDRLERTGMTWTISGANAMLKLRCLHLSEQWNDFIAFRTQREIQRLHPERQRLQQTDFQLAV